MLAKTFGKTIAERMNEDIHFLFHDMICCHCGKGYERMAWLRRHERKHREEVPDVEPKGGVE